jgi:SOUL heme-binding protein
MSLSMKKYALILMTFFTLGIGGCALSDVKEPPFTVVEKEEPYEIRAYAPMIIAEVQMTGERKQAINDGFKVLADYIFGKNDGGAEIKMTAPVTQQNAKGAKIAMTAPVTQQGGEGAWKVHFVMPEDYTMKTLPKPLDSRIRIYEQPAYKAAVTRFSGLAGDKALQTNESALRAWAEKKALKTEGEAVYAFYNPPWTLPFLRRNEIILPLAE